MKKVLLLGGAMQQIPSILTAKNLGYYAITCDYLPENPGHRLADEYYNVSTTDKETVLELAQKLHIDGIVAYASDPAAPTAAYVAEKMGLPTSPYKSVEILSNKDLFRIFQAENGFCYPKTITPEKLEEAMVLISELRFPVMVKPVDSSGTKGITKVQSIAELPQAVNDALSYSRAKRFVIEEFIEKKGYQVSGDGFSVDGKLVFTSYGNEFYCSDGKVKDYTPLGEFWPCILNEEMQTKINAEIQRMISCLDMKTTAYNIEVILDKDDNIYILELGPRSGGSYIPQLIQYATGVDLVQYVIKAAVGDDCSDLEMRPTHGVWSNSMIYSSKSGKFVRLEFEPDFQKCHLVEVFCTAKPGDTVHKFSNAGHSLGTILMKFDSVEDAEFWIPRLDDVVNVIIE